MGFGRPVNQAESLDLDDYADQLEELKHEQLILSFEELATKQKVLEYKLDQILKALERRST